MTTYQGNTGSPSQQEENVVEKHQKMVATLSPENKLAYGTLLDMLSFRRPHGSRSERRFIAKFLAPLGIERDKFGNLYKIIGDNPQVMWSSHTDTVHVHKGMQELGFAGDEIGLSVKESVSTCLGADDGAGVFLMHEMILQERPGLYVFHRAEEGGRKGSLWLAKNNPDLLKNIKFAIALDRRAKGSIITFQSSDRCCSEEFSKSLANELKMDFKSDDTGSFTDTYSYIDLIPECTNLSVGYTSAHSKAERQDVAYLFKLRDALMNLDVSKLEQKRNAGDKERKVYTYSGGTHYHGRHGDDDWGFTNWTPVVYMDGTDPDKGYAYINQRKVNLDLEFHNNAYRRHLARVANKESTKAPVLPLESPFDKEGKLLVFNGPSTSTATGAAPVTLIGAEPGATVTAGGREMIVVEEESAATKFSQGRCSIHEVPESQGGMKPDNDDDDDDDALSGLTTQENFIAMMKIIKLNPEPVADMMEQMGYNASDLVDEIMSMYGTVNC